MIHAIQYAGPYGGKGQNNSTGSEAEEDAQETCQCVQVVFTSSLRMECTPFDETGQVEYQMKNSMQKFEPKRTPDLAEIPIN